MRKTPETGLQSDPACCNLQSGCKQMSLNCNGFSQNSRLHAVSLLRKSVSSPSPTVVRKVNFKDPPPAGTVLMVQGQRYVLVATAPYRRLDGRPSLMLHWEHHGAECGSPFSTQTGLESKWLNRRCAKHHRAGVPVSRSQRLSRGAK
jgi:hypothetical protein